MRALLTISVLGALVLAATSSLAVQEQKQNDLGRHGRSVSTNSNGANSLANGIDHTSSAPKAALEMQKRQVQEFLTTKNILKSIMKLLFGNQDEISATSRHVLGILGKVLDLLKTTFGQKSRSGTARTFRDSAEDAANAGVSILQGYVKSVLTENDKCKQRYLCQASKDAHRDSREMGYVIASIGGYATSYMLDSKPADFKSLWDASLKGRSMNEDCSTLYPECKE